MVTADELLALTATAGWNPHYAAYAASQGRTPEAQAELDTEAGMFGFVVWCGARMASWRAETGVADVVRLSGEQLDEFGAWLAAGAAERAGGS